MKELKKIKRGLAMLLTVIFLSPTVISCTTDKEEVVSNDKYRQQALKVINAIDLVKSDLAAMQNANRMISGVEITQEVIDDYAVNLGYDQGEITLERVESIMDEYEVINNIGVEAFLEDHNLTQFTKITLKDISEGNWIEDIENHPEYINLNFNEKELLSFINAYAQEWDEQGRANGSSNFWAGFGALAGAMAGGLLCGPCIFVGGLIGGLIGSGTK